MVHQQAFTCPHCYGKFVNTKKSAASHVDRSTARMLQSELVKDGNIDTVILDQLCAVFEGGM